MALDAGLVTALEDARRSSEDRLAEITGEDEDTHSYKAVDCESYLAVRAFGAGAGRSRRQGRRSSSSPRARSSTGEQPPGMVGGDTLATQLREARMDDDVKAVVLRIDSPGGSILACEVIRREVASSAQPPASRSSPR